MQTMLTNEMKRALRIPYAVRRVPAECINCLLPYPNPPCPGDIVLARLQKIGRNSRLELANGRRAGLREGDLLAAVFGNRYATNQFHGHARYEGDSCDLLSMAGVCGLVESKHEAVPDPSKLQLLGALGDAEGRPLKLRSYALEPIAAPPRRRPHVIVVCGTAMDTGKTQTARSLIIGLRRREPRVAAIKLTGTASGRDTWTFADSSAYPAFDFGDGGFPSTYMCTLQELLDLYALLLNHAMSLGAEWVIVEIADGLLQRETTALLQSPSFTATVGNVVLATADPLAAYGGVGWLRGCGIEPLAISGLLTTSRLAMREAELATGVTCITASDLRRGALNKRLLPSHKMDPAALSVGGP